jgi:hypothetical protein
MSNANEQMLVEFHNSATARFFSTYHAFENAASQVNRKKEEYRFQQLKKQYTVTMEHELQAVARAILERHQEEKQVKEMDQMFHQFIKDYLHRFILKINNL